MKQLEKWYVWDGKGEKPKWVKSFYGTVGIGMTIYTLGEKVESKRGKDDN